MAGVRRGAFTCVGWQVTLCDPIWQVTSRSSEMVFPCRAISGLYPYAYGWLIDWLFDWWCVTAGVEVIINPPSITLTAGDEARFDCSARSHIDVEVIEWSRDGDRLPEGPTSFTILPLNLVCSSLLLHVYTWEVIVLRCRLRKLTDCLLSVRCIGRPQTWTLDTIIQGWKKPRFFGNSFRFSGF